LQGKTAEKPRYHGKEKGRIVPQKSGCREPAENHCPKVHDRDGTRGWKKGREQEIWKAKGRSGAVVNDSQERDIIGSVLDPTEKDV